eukprot:TRINITY_DN40696_c0_g1_i1.p1 TRINITY_DN40696_c0_g1~~TRINITY_DN40696_c0_g1_i1.p1  ORF type:complete len:355 (+),score=79.51 TRINITY_DN40696_c0_g1_i1:52-1116(+)
MADFRNAIDAPVFAVQQRSAERMPPISTAAEEVGWSGCARGTVAAAGAESPEPDGVPRAGMPSRPQYCGRRVVARRPRDVASPRHAADIGGLTSPYGERSVHFYKARGGSPPQVRDRRRSGLTRAFTLPSDYSDGAWVRTSDSYGAGQHVSPPPQWHAHDVDMHRSHRDPEGSTWAPPSGWTEDGPTDWRGRWLPADPCVLFGSELPDGSANPFGRHPARAHLGPNGQWPPTVPPEAIEGMLPPPRDDGEQGSAPPVREPDMSRPPVPLRPPCCRGGTAPARHAWREEEPVPPTAVVQLDRPAMLPRTEQPPFAPAPIPPKLSAIFGAFGSPGRQANTTAPRPPWATHDDHAAR